MNLKTTFVRIQTEKVSFLIENMNQHSNPVVEIRPVSTLHYFMNIFGHTSKQEAMNDLQQMIPEIIFQFIDEGDASSEEDEFSNTQIGYNSNLIIEIPDGEISFDEQIIIEMED